MGKVTYLNVNRNDGRVGSVPDPDLIYFLPDRVRVFRVFNVNLPSDEVVSFTYRSYPTR
jgi:hypothetical protein